MSTGRYASYIYFARGGDFVKIGVSSNPQQRVASLATGSPHPLTLLGTIRGDERDEAAMHGLFADLRANREWFRAEPRLLIYIPWAVDRDEQLFSSVFALHEQAQEAQNQMAMAEDGSRVAFETLSKIQDMTAGYFEPPRVKYLPSESPPQLVEDSTNALADGPPSAGQSGG